MKLDIDKETGVIHFDDEAKEVIEQKLTESILTGRFGSGMITMDDYWLIKSIRDKDT